jgi:hypothetical protein
VDECIHFGFACPVVSYFQQYISLPFSTPG